MRYLATQFMRDEDEVVADSAAWDAVFSAHRKAIGRIDNPPGSGALTLRRPGPGVANDPAWLRARFLRQMALDGAGGAAADGPEGFDLVVATEDGITTSFDWADGDLAGVRRSIAGMAAALRTGAVRAAILIVPSGDLKELLDLPDRATTMQVMQVWTEMAEGIDRGTFGITMVEHDGQTDDPAIPPLAVMA
jgi:hypothetical protein